jgi:hypothetical protein
MTALDRGWVAALPRPYKLLLMSGTEDERVREGWSYSGEVWTNAYGRAVVALPIFVRTHRAGFEYELTPVDSACSATVKEEIVDDHFTIATDDPHVKVAWRVTALKGQRP